MLSDFPATSLPPKPRASWVRNYMLSQDVHIGLVWDEVAETLEALRQGQFREALTEAEQVWFTLQLWIFAFTGLDFPLVGCSRILTAHFHRFHVWRQIFARFHQEPRLSYFRNGTNWRRPAKVAATLSRAGIPVSLPQADRIVAEILHPSGGKGSARFAG